MEKPKDSSYNYHELNAMLNLYGADGKIQFEKDRQAARQYFLEHVNKNTVFFHNLKERLDYLVEDEYYEKELQISTHLNSLPRSMITPIHLSLDLNPSLAPLSFTPATR